MRHVFDVHGELGRLFHKKIYQREVAFRVPDAQRKVLVEIQFRRFLQALLFRSSSVAGRVILEMKTVETLSERHRRQLMHYLFLTGLPHGKLVNLRPDRVEHEFVNNTTTFADRASFAVANNAWQELGTVSLQQSIIAMLRDWGTGLDLGLTRRRLRISAVSRRMLKQRVKSASVYGCSASNACGWPLLGRRVANHGAAIRPTLPSTGPVWSELPDHTDLRLFNGSTSRNGWSNFRPLRGKEE